MKKILLAILFLIPSLVFSNTFINNETFLYFRWDTTEENIVSHVKEITKDSMKLESYSKEDESWEFLGSFFIGSVEFYRMTFVYKEGKLSIITMQTHCSDSDAVMFAINFFIMGDPILLDFSVNQGSAVISYRIEDNVEFHLLEDTNDNYSIIAIHR